jgi:digeranylgeranylglycerophospholipid reductase
VKDRYDVVVVGGGPAGSWAAKHAAEKGVSVLMLEKDREIGIPVRCGEGAGAVDLARVVEVKERWIAHRLMGARMIAPDGTVLEAYPGETGYILHRKLFDADLAAMAAQAGAEVRTKAYVCGLLTENGRVTGVRVNHLGHEFRISATVVIGADGVESRVGRWGGIQTQLSPEDMVSCIQFVLAHKSIDQTTAEFRFGRRIAPGGYLWIFPRGDNTANVGLGVSGSYSLNKKPIYYLREYVERTFQDASVLSMVAGGVPAGPPLKDIISDGLMLAGDAARQINPLSGGGIVNAMLGGRIAGRVAAEAVIAGDISRKFLSVYTKEWHRVEGKNNELYYKMKTMVDHFKDEDLNRVARTLEKIPPTERNAVNVFKSLLFKHPKLLLEFTKTFF